MKREDRKRSEIPTTRARTDVKSQTQSREIWPIWPEDIHFEYFPGNKYLRTLSIDNIRLFTMGPRNDL